RYSPQTTISSASTTSMPSLRCRKSCLCAAEWCGAASHRRHSFHHLVPTDGAGGFGRRSVILFLLGRLAPHRLPAHDTVGHGGGVLCPRPRVEPRQPLLTSRFLASSARRLRPCLRLRLHRLAGRQEDRRGKRGGGTRPAGPLSGRQSGTGRTGVLHELLEYRVRIRRLDESFFDQFLDELDLLLLGAFSPIHPLPQNLESLPRVLRDRPAEQAGLFVGSRGRQVLEALADLLVLVVV